MIVCIYSLAHHHLGLGGCECFVPGSCCLKGRSLYEASRSIPKEDQLRLWKEGSLDNQSDQHVAKCQFGDHESV